MKVEEAIKEWSVDNFISTICRFCEFVYDEESDFRQHLLENHKEEIKEYFDLE